MPEFVMEGRDESAREESSFVHGFIEVMFFTNVANGETRAKWWNKRVQNDLTEGRLDGCLPEDCGYHDLTKEALQKIRKFCQQWQEKNADLLESAYALEDYDETQAGRDFFYTHCGHGVGYWDREELESYDKAEYERLTDIMVSVHATDKTAWQEALDKRNAIESESIGKRLTEAAGYGEIIPYYGRSGKISVDLY